MKTFIKYYNLDMHISEWSRLIGTPISTLAARKRRGWSDEKIIETPVTGRGRATAINYGYMGYIGKPCVDCGNDVRYTSSGKCAACSRKWWTIGELERLLTRTRPTRMQAMADNELYYEGAPCKKCGNTVRYTSSGACMMYPHA